MNYEKWNQFSIKFSQKKKSFGANEFENEFLVEENWITSKLFRLNVPLEVRLYLFFRGLTFSYFV